MKKITIFLALFLLYIGVSVAQTAWYKPGERKTSFAVGDRMFIYNTTKVPNLSQDRTGFLVDKGSNPVALEKQKPFHTPYISSGQAGWIWTVAAASESNGVYTLQLTNSDGKYLDYKGNADNTEAKTLIFTPYVESSKKSGNDVEMESIDGNTSVYPTANDAVWVIGATVADDASDDKIYWNGNEATFAKWSTGHPYAFYTVVDATDEYNAAMTQFNVAASGLRAKAGTVTEKNFTLTSTNLTSNATAAYDGEGIAGLIDDDASTYFHSCWDGNKTPVPSAYHYLMVDLGEAATEAFKFGYTTRDHQNTNHPSRIRIWGSNDNTDFEEITVLTREADGLVNGSKASYESNIIVAGKSYRYIRFDVEATIDGRGLNGFPYFALSAFDFKAFDINPGTGLIAASTAKMYDALDDKVQSLCAASIVTGSEIAAATSLLNRMSAISDLPFTVSDASNPVYYAIQQPGRGENKNWTLYYDKGGYVKLEQSADYAKDANKYWFFTLSKNGYIQIVPMAEPNSPLGNIGTGAGAKKLTNLSSVAGVTGNEYEYEATDNADAPIALKIPGTGMYISNWGGESNYMGLYGSVDDGTRLKFVPVVIPDNVDDIIAVQAVLNQLPDGAAVGEGLGKYTCSNSAAYTNAVNALKNITETDMSAISSSVAGMTFALNAPTTGKFYRFKALNANKYMSSTESVNVSNQTLMELKEGVSPEENMPETVFYWDNNNRLVALSNGKCLGKFTNKDTDFHLFLAADANSSSNVQFRHVLDGNGNFYFNILPSNNRYLHNGGTTVDCAGGDNDANYRWSIEEVKWLPISINEEAGYATLCSPVSLKKGYDRDRVKAYAGTVEGDYLKLNEIEGDIPANTPVVLQYVFDIQSNKCVYLGTMGEAASYEGKNDLDGKVLAESVAEDASVLTLQLLDGKAGFYKYTGDVLNGFKAYLTGDFANFAVNGFSFNTGDTTGVDGVKTGRENEVFYDLNGRMVTYPSKGIYVTASGKKVLLK